jgi:DNA-binding NarL/FixJ family response regulator
MTFQWHRWEGVMSISIIVADDQPLVRAAIAVLLQAEPDFEVLAEAADGQEAVDLARGHHPDLVVMDARMPVLDGISATRLITSEAVEPNRLTKVLVLTTFDDDEVVYGALKAGASGFLLKHVAPRELSSAVRTIAAGNSWIDPAVTGRVIAALASLPEPNHDHSQLIGCLTDREREVLALIAVGLSNAEIKERLFLSEATVRTHVSRILMKTGSRDRAHAVVRAYQGGLVDPSSGDDGT